MDLPTLRGDRVLLRALVEDDLDGLIAILAEPAVARWWGPQAEQPDREELLGPEPRFAIVVDGALAGWLGCEENTDPMYRSVGLDIFLTTARQGQGLGREALRLVIAHYLERGHTASPSTRRPTTSGPSGPTRPSGSSPSVACATTSSAPTAPGTTAY